MRKDYILTYVIEFVVLSVSLLVYRLAAALPGSGFSEYALSARVVALLVPLFALGFFVGIPRYVAHDSQHGDVAVDNYLFGGLICSGIFCLVFCVVAAVFRETFSSLVFGSAEYVFLVWPCLAFVVGQLFIGFLYGYLRGQLKMGLANIFQLFVSGLAPLLAFFFFSESCATVITARGVLVIGMCLLFLVPIVCQGGMRIGSLATHTLKLLKYGIGRVPGDFSLAAIFMLPASYVAHTAGIEKAGAFAFGISLLNMAGYMFAPVGVILLPHASKFIAEGKLSGLREGVKRLILVAVVLVICGTVVFEIGANYILRLYLGAEIGSVSSIARVCMLGVLPLVVFYLLRSIIDAWHVRAVNSCNIIISLVVMGMLMLLGHMTNRNSEIWNALYLVLSLFILGGLTLRDVVRVFAQEAGGVAENRRNPSGREPV